MSYSFNVKAPSKADAKAAVEKAFDGVVASQPIHARDRAAALATASAVIDLLAQPQPDDPLSHVSVSVNGYVSWRENLKEDGSNDLTGASVSVSAALATP